MCTFQAGCKVLKNKGVTLFELLLVIIIIGIMAGIAGMGWQAQVEKEYARNAQSALKVILQAETNYFTWKNRYTNDLTALSIDDPNKDNWYGYEVEEATALTLRVRATRRTKNTGFFIDQDGNITSF
ncbi:MAG: prepilin-type N-terminal cleavage/methylation domain-containing protein [Candidatus Omnitrophota bacterium]